MTGFRGKETEPLSINVIILVSFTIITAAALMIIGLALYSQFAS